MPVFEPVPERFDFPAHEREILAFWKDQAVFRKSLEQREGAPTFVFYEGPPTANGRGVACMAREGGADGAAPAARRGRSRCPMRRRGRRTPRARSPHCRCSTGRGGPAAGTRSNRPTQGRGLV